MIHITLGGERRPFKFGFNAIDIFCREHSIDIAEFANRLEQLAGGSAPPGELRDIIYAGLAGGALSCGLPAAFTNIQVGDWLDELPAGELTKIVDAFTESVSVPGKKKEKAAPQPPMGE